MKLKSIFATFLEKYSSCETAGLIKIDSVYFKHFYVRCILIK
jgi:hypothetical protein